MIIPIKLFYRLKKWWLNNKKLILTFSLVGIVGYVYIQSEDPIFENDYSHTVLDRNDEILRVYLNKNDQWVIPIEYQETVPNRLKVSILTFEDQYFYYHFGINPVSIFNAWRLNRKKGRVVSGASTITMQLARLSNPKERNYKNKILEIFNALKFELKYSKGEILKQYITHAPFGGNIQGYYAASFLYFNKKPISLTWAEAALLAVLPNSPSKVTPLINKKELLKKRNVLLKRLYDKGYLTLDEYYLSIEEAVPNKRYYFDILAPHLSDQIRLDHTDQYIHRTTISKGLQTDIETIVKDASKRMSNLGINNISVVVADTKTAEILTYIGSQNYFDTKNNGAVNGARAWRSPGSTLKPLLYALSMDKGLALPETKLFDIPTNIQGFTPQNMSEKFYGVVSMKKALIESLNIPATRVLHDLGLDEFYYFLKSAGLKTLFRDADDYGLSLILGGSEVTVEDIAMLYRGLGNGGRFSNLHYLKSEKSMYEKQLLSPGASYLTLEMMNDLVRPGTEYFWNIFSTQWPLSWKTGTSYGQRDAWAVGVTPQYTIAVWVGNFTGESNALIGGTKTAGPILFEIFNYLPKSPYMRWFEQPEDHLKKVELCNETGLMAGPFCMLTKLNNAPKTMLAMNICPYHKLLHLNEKKTHQVCSKCWDHESKQIESRLIYPPSVRKVMLENGQSVDYVPIHNPQHENYRLSETMSWIYPKENSKIWIPRDIDGEYQKVPAKIAHINNDVAIFWYLNNEFIGKTRTLHEKPLLFKTGHNTLLAIDSNGQRESITFSAILKE